MSFFLYMARWWWWWSIQSGWSLNFHFSESQTGTQHGSDRWEPLSFIHHKQTHLHCIALVKYIPKYSFFHCLTFVLQSSATELARTPAKSVTFSTDTKASTPTRPGRSKRSQPSSLVCCCQSLHPSVTFASFPPSLPEQRGGSRTPQKVTSQCFHSLYCF